MRPTALRNFLFLLQIILLTGCGSEDGALPSVASNDPPARPGAASDSLKPADPESIWAAVLVDCVEAEVISESCSLDRLPLIGMDNDDPDIDVIMERLVVSHDWMAVRFEQLLQRLPRDIRLMMRSLTAVVISHEVRPSYYSSGTGAIYLDPDDLWLTENEREVVPTTPDPRASFDDALAFVSLWRYVEGFGYAWSNSRSAPRSLDDIELPMAALLFHELAHANDFFPQSRFHLLNPGLSVYLNATLGSDRRLSNSIDAPTSQTLFDLADVMYFGETASPAQLQLQPGDVAAEFRLDSASAMYGYATQYEDFAMLVEEVLMRHHYGLQRDSGFTNRPQAGSPRSAYILAWGMRQRAFDPLVRNRAIRAMQLLFNQTDVTLYFPPAVQSQLLDSGISWDTSILSGSGAQKRSEGADSQEPDGGWFRLPFLPFDPQRMAP